MKKLLSILIIFLTFACNEKPQNDIDRTAKIYVDLLIIEESYRGMPDSLKQKKQNLFKQYDVTEEEYNESYVSMGSNMEEWNKFFAASLTYLDTLKVSGEKKKPDALPAKP